MKADKIALVATIMMMIRVVIMRVCLDISFHSSNNLIILQYCMYPKAPKYIVMTAMITNWMKNGIR